MKVLALLFYLVSSLDTKAIDDMIHQNNKAAIQQKTPKPIIIEVLDNPCHPW